MKIILVNPPFEQNYPIIRNRRKKAILEIVQPLGLAYIAAVLEKNNYQVKIFDCAIGISQLDLIESLKKEQPDIVGITATSLSFLSAKNIAARIRACLPRSYIIIGGPHITASPGDLISCKYFDAAVIGEGEATFLELVKRIENSGLECLGDMEGIAYLRGDDVVLNRKRDFIGNLNELPFPARHLLRPLYEYFPFSASYRKLPVATIISSRGCPLGCTFCDQAIFGTVYRSRNADNILDEVELLIGKFGAREIRFYDDVFTWNRNSIFELCEKMKKRNIKVSWTCFATVNTITKELLQKMKDAGCWQVSFGLESGDPTVLKALKKNITLEENKRALRLAAEAGLGVRAHFVVGSPWETKESLEKTLDFAKKSRIDYAHFIKFMPYPGSIAYRMLAEKGYQFDYNQKFNMLDNADIMYVPGSMTKEEFMGFLNRAKRQFYFRLSYILRRLVSVRTWLEVKAQIFGSLAFFLHYNFSNHEENISN